MFEEPEIFEQQIAAQEAEKKAQVEAEAAPEEPVQAAVTEVLEIKTAQSEDEAKAGKKSRRGPENRRIRKKLRRPKQSVPGRKTEENRLKTKKLR